jgi:8-oxo-dGTP pyrophosphatase MutT (NUDIX family)
VRAEGRARRGRVASPPTDPHLTTDAELHEARRETRRLVAELAPTDEVGLAHRDQVLAWIDGGDPLWRTAKPATPPTHLVAYAVVVDPHERSILLVDHRLAGKWLPTGGHVEPGEQPIEAAERELIEELGIAPPPLVPERRPLLLTRTPVTNVGETSGHVDVSLWFAFAGRVADELHPDPGEFHAVRWWPFDEVVHGPGTRFDPHLPRFVAAVVASVTGAARRPLGE